MDILSGYGLNDQLLKEIQDYFYPMAKRTGTLWEHMGLQGSCNHGFASYIGHILYRDILGISRIDYLKKELTIQFTNIDLNECSGAIPVGEGSVELKWKRSGNQIRYAVKVPSGYKVNVENRSSFKLMNDE
jgi:alpha-L-rhamnosidase